ncbi:MAG: hypothetical protein N2Z85_02600, partial [Patescibacteria group bacterium]|nr:hypothetical protein [Patescibacteria group bacterium]
TKKDILRWWIDRGCVNEKDDLRSYKDDLKDFRKRIDKSLKIEEEKKGNITLIKVYMKRCKYPLGLFFEKNECYKIFDF